MHKKYIYIPIIILLISSSVLAARSIININNSKKYIHNSKAAEQSNSTQSKPQTNSSSISHTVNHNSTSNNSNLSNKVSILMYHSISDVPVGLKELSVSKKSFEQQIKYLINNDYTPLFFDELEKFDTYKKPIIITFDDGYKDNYYNAYPILKKYNCKATIFIIAKYLNGPGFLNTYQIKEMSDLISFQSHAVNHRKMAELNEIELIEECSLSKKMISEITQKSVYALSYPFGSFSENVVNVTSRYYTYAVTVQPGYYTKNSPKLEIKRVRVSRSDSSKSFAAKIK